MNQPNVGEVVNWEAVEVKAASINVTWEYKPAVRDGDKIIDTFLICYKMSNRQNCSYTTTFELFIFARKIKLNEKIQIALLVIKKFIILLYKFVIGFQK